jgi:hypothetical protein
MKHNSCAASAQTGGHAELTLCDSARDLQPTAADMAKRTAGLMGVPRYSKEQMNDMREFDKLSAKMEPKLFCRSPMCSCASCQEQRKADKQPALGPCRCMSTAQDGYMCACCKEYADKHDKKRSKEMQDSAKTNERSVSTRDRRSQPSEV